MGFSSQYSPIFLPCCPIFLNHVLLQPSTIHILCSVPVISPCPCPPPFFPLSVLPISPPFPPFLQTPQSWFGELVGAVAVSADACWMAVMFHFPFPLSFWPLPALPPSRPLPQSNGVMRHCRPRLLGRSCCPIPTSRGCASDTLNSGKAALHETQEGQRRRHQGVRA